jgi:hypothetical protein
MGPRGLLTICQTAERVVSCGGGVASSVTLSTWLTPDKGISKSVASGGCWADTEAGTVDVAPVTPLKTETSDGIAAGIHDGVVGMACGRKSSTKIGDVAVLILALVVLSVRGVLELSRSLLPGVPPSNVGGNTTDLRWGASGLVNLGKTLSAGCFSKC